MGDCTRKNLIVVCGSTASGKTALGVRIALRYKGEIISGDSRQVYRGMDIGTGKDLAEYSTEKGAVPYHLIDIVDPQEVYTVYNFQQDFYRIFGEISSRTRLPVLVGGTGLYIEAVLRNYAIPNVPENPALRAMLMSKDAKALEEELRQTDPALCKKTDLSSKKRIVRSIEIAHAHRDRGDKRPALRLPEIKPVVLGVVWERPRLRERIRTRLLARLELGMVEEVRRLLDTGIPQERFAMFGMEYKQVARYLRKEVGYEEMVETLLRDIGQLAKRQESYFRGMERRGVAVLTCPPKTEP
jgi:tRNA dimethylallyltransferase